MGRWGRFIEGESIWRKPWRTLWIWNMERTDTEASPAKDGQREGQRLSSTCSEQLLWGWTPRRPGVERSQRHLHTPVTGGRPGATAAPRAPESSLPFWGSDPHKRLPVGHHVRTPDTLSLTTRPLTQPPSSLLKSSSLNLQPVVTIRSRLAYTLLPETLTRSPWPFPQAFLESSPRSPGPSPLLSGSSRYTSGVWMLAYYLYDLRQVTQPFCPLVSSFVKWESSRCLSHEFPGRWVHHTWHWKQSQASSKDAMTGGSCSGHSLRQVRLFATPWIAALQASLSITNSRSLLKLMSIESVMPSNHLILCRLLLLLPPIPSSIRVFSNESTLHIRCPKYWSFSFSISPSNEHPGLISFRKDWLDLLAVQGTLKSLLQQHSSKASILWRSAFFIVQLSHPYMTTGKTIALTGRTFVGKVMSLLFNMLSRLVIVVITVLLLLSCVTVVFIHYSILSLLSQGTSNESTCLYYFPISKLNKS